MALDDAVLAQLFKPVLEAHGVNTADFSDDYIARAAGLVKSRISFVNDLWDNARFFFVAPEEYDPKAVKKRWSADMPAIMTALADLLEKDPTSARHRSSRASWRGSARTATTWAT